MKHEHPVVWFTRPSAEEREQWPHAYQYCELPCGRRIGHISTMRIHGEGLKFIVCWIGAEEDPYSPLDPKMFSSILAAKQYVRKIAPYWVATCGAAQDVLQS
jgi:hypothetical protein